MSFIKYRTNTGFDVLSPSSMNAKNGNEYARAMKEVSVFKVASGFHCILHSQA
jgi:hypothetical protein